ALVALAVDVAVLLASVAAGLVVLLMVTGRRHPPVLLPLALAGVIGGGGYWATEHLDRQHALPVPGDRVPIVLVVSDTPRAAHLGSYGHSVPTSPHLERFARRAVVYEQARSHASWTLPAMGSLFTGRNPSTHGAGVNDGVGNRRSALRRDVPTL